MTADTSVFHAGELEAQRRAGALDVVNWAPKMIRPFMPDQHREFFTAQPFLVLSGADSDGRTWVTLVDGPDGFVRSPDAQTLSLATSVDPQDPLAAMFSDGGDVGMVGIELATRRRNRLTGAIRREAEGYVIDVRQSFGNCPQYISEREWRRVERAETPAAIASTHLTVEQMNRIQSADTLFIGSGQQGEAGAQSNGFDASHRGGELGFVRVIDETRLRIPDYAGNNIFNTIGNVLQNTRVGLVFIDFENGGLLHLSGTAEIDWDAEGFDDPAVRWSIDITIYSVIDRPEALSLRWDADASPLRQLKVTKKVIEADGVASFHLAPTDDAPLEAFEAGQHLPIQLEVDGAAAPVKRT